MLVNAMTREKVEALIREQVTPAIFQDTPKESVVMSLGKKLPNMSSKTTRIRVTDLLPMAYWVDGDTGMKQTSAMAWDNVYLTAGELAVIVPIPEAVLDDAEFDILGEVKPRVIEAIGQKVDSAILFGVNRPREWQNDVITMARQSGNNVAPGSKDMFTLIMDEDGVLNKIEEDGYVHTGAVASTGMKAKLRGLKGTDGHPIFMTTMQGATSYGLDGAPLYFPDNSSGLPPLSRVLRSKCFYLYWDLGITPAHAGTTVHYLEKKLQVGDHTRSRGYYTNSFSVYKDSKGSPPLTRVLRQIQTFHHTRLRITPAHAGTTLSTFTCFSVALDHPRSRGYYTLKNPSKIRLHDANIP